MVFKSPHHKAGSFGGGGGILGCGGRLTSHYWIQGGPHLTLWDAHATKGPFLEANCF